MMQGHNRPPFAPKIPGTDIRSNDVPTAIIYRPSRAATTSAPRPSHWVLEFEPSRPQDIDPLMGWTTSSDPYRTVRMTFPDRESAVDYAVQNDWRYFVREEHPRQVGPNPWAGKSHHRLYRGVDTSKQGWITSGQSEGSAHRLYKGSDAPRAQERMAREQTEELDPVLEADMESFPASDPPAWTGTTISGRKA